MSAKPGKKFCAEHGGVDQEGEGKRTPCPYDPKHSCYLSKLRKHMNKCNSKPKEEPEYIISRINVLDWDYPEAEDEIYPIASIPDEALLEMIVKIERVFHQEDLECEKSVLGHWLVDAALANADAGTNARKHLLQNSSLIGNMKENGFLGDKLTFVDFGAGRGQLGFWITRAVESRRDCALLLIDRASHRHKSDNKLKGASPVRSQRIRADIADVELSRIPMLAGSGNEVVGVTKHLCGAATDLALRCIVNGKSNGVKVKGLAMALCCHHRCTWRSFVGKKFVLDVGFSGQEFSALCSMSSWATCGSGKPRAEEERKDGDRYGRLGLSQEVRERIGRKCKMILNHGRLKYLERSGFEGKLIYYVDQTVSPENVCIIAKLKSEER